MRNVNIREIPVTIGANKAISKSLNNYLNAIPRKHDINELKKQSFRRSTQTAGNIDVNLHSL